MVKAKFVGDADNSTYQCAEFHARLNDTVTMPNERWAAIQGAGKEGLFLVATNNEEVFPKQTTIGPKA